MKALKEYFKGLKKHPSKIFNDLIKLIKENKALFFMSFSFFALDLFTRFLGRNIGFFKVYRLAPNLFTICYIILFVGIITSFSKKVGKWIYLFLNILFIGVYLIYNVYYSMTSNFFTFNLIESTSEGAPYMLDAIRNCNILVYLLLIIVIGLIVFGFKNIPENKKFNKKRLLITLLIFIILHTLTPLFLGRANSSLVWSTWKNPRNIYNQYNDANKSMRVSGMYEYTFRSIYVTYLRKEKVNEEELEYLSEIYKEEKISSKNKYTGKFKGKNLIFLQLEGIDNWLVTKDTMPTLYNMMKNSINFTDHYSFYTGGGSTFNSEFAVNTGFIVPLSYNQNAYSFNNNYFPYSMAKLFKEREYVVNAFHMNHGEYYSRSINYKNWGYDNYYGLIDMFKYDNNEYELDRELILNEEFSNLMFPEDSSFVDYIITYSPHIPFNNKKGVCKMLYNMDKEELNEEEETSSTSEFVQMSEEECVRRQAKETDYMISLLIDKLKEKKLIDNTVIVAFSDHYLYTMEDQSVIYNYKKVSNNLINKTPFMIWDNGKTKGTVKKTTSQLNILPTILNLYGFEYNQNNYIMKDALTNNYSGIVFFSDYSWYDGNVYVEGGEVTNNKKISKESLEEKNILVTELARKNDLTLKYNYFKKISTNK